MSYDPEYHRRYRERHRERIKKRKQKEYLANQEKIKARSRAWSANNRERKLEGQRLYREANREKRLAYMKERYQKNPAAHVSAMSEWRKKNPEKYKDGYLRSVHGITLQDFNALVAAQNSCCAICRKKEAKLVVDHDHETSVIRGLLCGQCNCGIGNFQDNPASLASAVTYLLNPPAVSLLRAETEQIAESA